MIGNGVHSSPLGWLTCTELTDREALLHPAHAAHHHIGMQLCHPRIFRFIGRTPHQHDEQTCTTAGEHDATAISTTCTYIEMVYCIKYI